MITQYAERTLDKIQNPFNKTLVHQASDVQNHGPRYYLDTSALVIFGKSVQIKNLKKW